MTKPGVATSEMVGPYRVIKAIGGGGSARIDLARIERAYGFERDVVLKRPLEHLRSSPAVAASLRREASLGGRLRHPNIVSVLDAGEHGGYDYLVLEYIRGMSLRAAVDAAPGTVVLLPLDAALSIIIGIASGLEFAHELAGSDGLPLGLVHRDVSPANVLLGVDGTVKLADFGIAKDTHVDTLSGSLRGTVTYMAPEQCRGHAFDRRADVFSLGVILHELITGRRLFWADNDVASLHRVLSGAIPDPREAVPSIAPELAAIVMRALAHDASDRIPTAKQLATLLETFATHAGVLIGARRIQRALIASAPPSAQPQRSAAVTVPRLPTASPPDEPSLVTVIESTPDLDDITDTDGPPIVPSPREQPRLEVAPPRERPIVDRDAHVSPSRRRRVAILLAVTVTAGVAIAILVMQRNPDPEFPRVTAPVGEPPKPAPPSTAEPTKPTIPPATPAVVDESEITVEPTPTREPVRVRSRPRPTPKPVATAAGSGSGSNAEPKPPHPIRWNDKIILPSDSGSNR